MKMTDNEIQTVEARKPIVSLELAEEYLADIIVNFLGSKEKLNYKSDESFVLRLNDIEQFHYLLSEKVAKEQYVHIDNFNVTIRYNDSTSRTISSIEALKKFLETRDVISTGVALEWNIILQFPTSKTIESQKIQMNFDTTEKPGTGDVSLVVEHTNQAWGIEVVNLFKNKVAHVSIPTPTPVKIAKALLQHMNFQTYTILSGVFFFSYVLFDLSSRMSEFPKPTEETVTINKLVSGYYSGKDDELTEEYEKGLFLIKNLHFTQLDTASDSFISDESVKNIINEYRMSEYNKHRVKLTKSPWFRFISIVFFVLVLPYFGLYLLPKYYLNKTIGFYGTRSFLLATSRSERQYTSYNEGKNKYEYYTVGAIVFAVLCGIISGYIINLIQN